MENWSVYAQLGLSRRTCKPVYLQATYRHELLPLEGYSGDSCMYASDYSASSTRSARLSASYVVNVYALYPSRETQNSYEKIPRQNVLDQRRN